MDCTIETLVERPALGIHPSDPVSIESIGPKIGELMPVLMAVAGPHMAGPPLSRWLTWEGDAGEMELAVPVGRAVEGQGDVKATTLPGGRAVVCVHVGSYELLKETWQALGEWMKAEGHVGRDAPWEEYIDDCSVTPEAQLRTRIVWPIA